MTGFKNELVPYLTFKDAAAAVTLYEKALGAVETGPRITMPEGGIGHTELDIGGAKLMMSDEAPEYDCLAPTSGENCIKMSLVVEDVDGFFANALSAGFEELEPIMDMFYGHRMGRLKDPFGYCWIISSIVEELTEEEIIARAKEMFETASN